jgi:hypothetical protein
MNICTAGWINECMYGLMDEWMDVCMNGWMNGVVLDYIDYSSGCNLTVIYTIYIICNLHEIYIICNLLQFTIESTTIYLCNLYNLPLIRMN